MLLIKPANYPPVGLRFGQSKPAMRFSGIYKIEIHPESVLAKELYTIAQLPEDQYQTAVAALYDKTLLPLHSNALKALNPSVEQDYKKMLYHADILVTDDLYGADFTKATHWLLQSASLDVKNMPKPNFTLTGIIHHGFNGACQVRIINPKAGRQESDNVISFEAYRNASKK